MAIPDRGQSVARVPQNLFGTAGENLFLIRGNHVDADLSGLGRNP